MKPQNVDLVLLVDSSESMRPCFASLREHLKDLLYPLQQANFRVRFGLVAYAAGRDRGSPVYDHTFIGGSGPEMIQKLYSPSVSAVDFFTSDSAVVTRVLSGLEAQGNEDTLLALDIAADFPFGSPESTRRVIAVFTDEPLEAGLSEAEPMAKIPNLIQKLMSRRIQLFVSAPFSPAMAQLGSLDRAEIETVDGGDGLKSVDFKKLLAQMGKSISVSSLQMGPEPAWQKAIFGQDKFEPSRFSSAQDKSVIVRSGEIGGIRVQAQTLGVILDVSGSMASYLETLRQQIRRSFSDALFREVSGCSILTQDNLRRYQQEGFDSQLDSIMPEVEELVREYQIDSLYWFSDLEDQQDSEALAWLGEILNSGKVRFYVRSVGSKPNPNLQDLVLRTGGELKVERLLV